MWIKQIFLGILGISGGFAVAGGLFALLIALGVISRFAGKTHTAQYIFYYEDATAIGGIPVSYTHLEVYKRQGQYAAGYSDPLQKNAGL